MPQYTIRPNRNHLLQPGMMQDVPKLPKQTGTLVSHSVHQVEFPLFDHDPGMFLPEHLVSTTVDDLKEFYKRDTLAWTGPNEQPLNMPTLEQLNVMPLQVRAQALVDMMKQYAKQPAMPEAVHYLLLSTSKYTSDNMSPDNFRMALTGYVGHYAGEEMNQLFQRVVTHNTYTGNTQPGLAKALLASAAQVIRQQKAAIPAILESQNARGLSPSEKIAELGLAMVDLGLDSPEVHTVAHFPTFVDTQWRPQAGDARPDTPGIRR